MGDPVWCEGVFEYVCPGYGFIKKVKPVEGGEPLGKDVLLTASTATKCLANAHHVLKKYDGAKLGFHYKKSEVYPVKLPIAYNVSINDAYLL